MGKPFWETTALAAMSREQWESLCDGCALCCLQKLEDEDTGELFYTDLACRLLDLESTRCQDYQHRSQRVKDCLVLTPNEPDAMAWLPRSCAYRRLTEGKDLPSWHPLRTGDPDSVHAAGISARSLNPISESEQAEPSLYLKLS